MYSYINEITEKIELKMKTVKKYRADAEQLLNVMPKATFDAFVKKVFEIASDNAAYEEYITYLNGVKQEYNELKSILNDCNATMSKIESKASSAGQELKDAKLYDASSKYSEKWNSIIENVKAISDDMNSLVSLSRIRVVQVDTLINNIRMIKEITNGILSKCYKLLDEREAKYDEYVNSCVKDEKKFYPFDTWWDLYIRGGIGL